VTSVCDRARSTQVPAHIFNQDYARRTPEVQRQCSHRRYCASVKSRTNCAISICIVYILRIIKDLSRSCVFLFFFAYLYHKWCPSAATRRCVCFWLCPTIKDSDHDQTSNDLICRNTATRELW